MANPAIQLSFKRITGRPSGYLQRWEDRPRPGIDGNRFYYLGRRGKPKNLQVVQYFAGEAAAREALRIWEAAVGRTCTIVDELDDLSYDVFLNDLDASTPRKVTTNLPGITHRLTATITVTQTA